MFLSSLIMYITQQYLSDVQERIQMWLQINCEHFENNMILFRNLNLLKLRATLIFGQGLGL